MRRRGACSMTYDREEADDAVSEANAEGRERRAREGQADPPRQGSARPSAHGQAEGLFRRTRRRRADDARAEEPAEPTTGRITDGAGTAHPRPCDLAPRSRGKGARPRDVGCP